MYEPSLALPGLGVQVVSPVLVPRTLPWDWPDPVPAWALLLLGLLCGGLCLSSLVGICAPFLPVEIFHLPACWVPICSLLFLPVGSMSPSISACGVSPHLSVECGFQSCSASECPAVYLPPCFPSSWV